MMQRASMVYPESAAATAAAGRMMKKKKKLKRCPHSRIFSEDYNSSEKLETKVLDPQGPIAFHWRRVFMLACLASLFVDPLFLYLLETEGMNCMRQGVQLQAAVVVRSFADTFYAVHIFFNFRTAYIAPSSRILGRGELVLDGRKIAARYLKKCFWHDLLNSLPLPQLLLLAVVPRVNDPPVASTEEVLLAIVVLQYISRLLLIFPLSSSPFARTETAWSGAAYNLLLFMLAGHMLGACWYHLAMERLESCWKAVCVLDGPACRHDFFKCGSSGAGVAAARSWYRSSNLAELCTPSSGFYQFGIYVSVFANNVSSLPFLRKYFYCNWWGIQQPSSLGQNLMTSTYAGENCFATLVAAVGLVLFALLVENIQNYLQSATRRVEEWRVRRNDAEQWMEHRQLPPELARRVWSHDQHRWAATQGVDEEALLGGLPADLRRSIKRHLCLDLVRQVPVLDQMDDRTTDAICKRLYTRGSCLVREMDPVGEMLFIIRGHLESTAVSGGSLMIMDSCRVGPGDFCGEELLTWALGLRGGGDGLPSSTRSLHAVTDVEAFALSADDLRFVAARFWRMQSSQLQQQFRYNASVIGRILPTNLSVHFYSVQILVGG